MTEEEAKTKWCPFVRFTDETDGTYAVTNRGDVCDRSHNQNARDLSRCIGSDCMAWRFEMRICDKKTGKPIPLGQSYLKGTAELRPTTNGFCGLAGKP